MNRVFTYLFPPSLSSLAAFIVLFTLLTPRMPEMTSDPGLGWHLMSGKEILASWTIPRVDPFLAGSPQKPWVADQWLGSTILAAIFSVGSWEGLTLTILFSFFLLFFPLLYKTAYAASGSSLAGILAVAIACKLSSMHAIVRPIVPSLLLFGVMTCFLYGAKRALQGGKQLPHSLWLLPLLFVLWTNVHPYFVVGLVYLGVWIGGVLLDEVVLERKCLLKGNLRTLSLILGLSLLGTLCNPYGVDLHRAVFSLGSSEFFTGFLDEWKPLQVKTTEWEIVHFIAGLLILASIFSGEFRKRWGFSELLLTSGLLHFTLHSVRGAPLFAIATAPLLATAFTDIARLNWFQRFPITSRVSSNLSSLEKREQRSSHSIWGAITGMGCLLALFFFQPQYFGKLSPSNKKFPWDALPALLEQGERGDVVFNHLDWSGFIVLMSEGELRPIIDDRLTVTPEARYKKYLFAYNHPKKILQLFPETEFILTPTNDPPAQFFSSSGRGEIVYKSDSSSLIRIKAQ